MLADEFWRTHVLETVFAGHPPFVHFLYDKGILNEWLDAKYEEVFKNRVGITRELTKAIEQ